MYWLVGLITLSLVGIVVMGVAFELRPLPHSVNAPRWLKGTVGANLVLFVLAEAGLLLASVHDALAAVPAAVTPDVSYEPVRCASALPASSYTSSSSPGLSLNWSKPMSKWSM